MFMLKTVSTCSHSHDEISSQPMCLNYKLKNLARNKPLRVDERFAALAPAAAFCGIATDEDAARPSFSSSPCNFATASDCKLLFFTPNLNRWRDTHLVNRLELGGGPSPTCSPNKKLLERKRAPQHEVFTPFKIDNPSFQVVQTPYTLSASSFAYC